MADKCETGLEGLCTAARKLVLGSPLAEDMDRLLQLSVLEPEDQQRIIRLHLNLEVPWEAAISSARPASPSKRRLGNVGDTVTVNVGELRANKVNSTIFAESLSDEGIESLIDDIGRRSLRVPVEILVDGTIIEGERRWLAACKGGKGTTILAKIVAEAMTDAEIRAYIYDAHATTRDASIGERVRFFHNAVAVLKERHGLPSGRPKASSGDQGLPGPQLRELAAKHAGFRSEATARRAARVLAEGTDEIKKGLLNGTLTIYAAHEMLGGDDEPDPDESDDLAPPDSPVGALPAAAENPIKRPPPAPSTNDTGGPGDTSRTSPPPDTSEGHPQGQTATSVDLPASPGGHGNEKASGKAPDKDVPVGASPGTTSASRRRTPEKGAAATGARPKTRPQRRSQSATDSSQSLLAYERAMVDVLGYFAHLRDNDPDQAAAARIDHISQIDDVLGDLIADEDGDASLGAATDNEANGEVDLNVSSDPDEEGPDEEDPDPLTTQLEKLGLIIPKGKR